MKNERDRMDRNTGKTRGKEEERKQKHDAKGGQMEKNKKNMVMSTDGRRDGGQKKSCREISADRGQIERHYDRNDDDGGMANG